MDERVGVNAVIQTLKKLGVTQNLPNYPSLLLGTANLSPMEVLRLYQPFASNGFQPHRVPLEKWLMPKASV